jgi:hypothetical protein
MSLQGVHLVSFFSLFILFFDSSPAYITMSTADPGKTGLQDCFK